MAPTVRGFHLDAGGGSRGTSQLLLVGGGGGGGSGQTNWITQMANRKIRLGGGG